MVLAVPGTVNTVQNGFSLAGSAPKQTQPINWNAINTTAPKTSAPSAMSQVAAAAPAVSTPKPFNIAGSAPTQTAPINWGAINTNPAPTAQPQMATYPPAPQSQAPVPNAQPVNNAPGNPGLINPQALNPQVSFPGIVGSLAQTSQQGTPVGQQLTSGVAQTAQGNIPIGQQAQDITNKYASFINPALQEAAGEEIGNLTGGGLFPVGQGIASQIASATGQELQGLSSQEAQQLAGVGQQLTAQQQAQSGLGTAAGLAQTQQQLTQSGLGTAGQLTAPSVAGYGQTAFNPLTRGFGAGGGGVGSGTTGGGGFDPYSQASTLAQKVINGQMSYADAVNSLGYAGSAGQTFLNNAINQISPGFNINQAQVNSQIQGQLAPQAALATGELNNLQATLAQAPSLQQTGIPVINAIGSWINNMLGNPSSKALSDAQSAATSAVGTALATAYGGTPTSYDNLINTWFPPNATPDQIAAGVKQFNNLIEYRTQSFGSPGTVPLPGSTTATNNASTYQSPSGNTYTLPY